MHLGLVDGDIDVREGLRSLLESVGLRVWAQVILATPDDLGRIDAIDGPVRTTEAGLSCCG